jgi:predicted protein tyrosine phosphatase
MHFFRHRTPDQMLVTAAPWSSPWLPEGYGQDFWKAALDATTAGAARLDRSRPVVVYCWDGL